MPSVVRQFLQELGYVLLEHRGQGRFAPLTEPPAWFHVLWPAPIAEAETLPLGELSPFLENFLLEAEPYWNSQQPGECRSETWIEKSGAGKEVPVQAIALHLEGKHALALHSPDLEFREQVNVLQAARNALLEHERLLREIQKKEILLHCIIHDLSQPLSVMHVALDCIAGEEISERGKQFAQLGKLASEQQEAMIRGVLNAFSEDLKAVMEAEGKTDFAPDLLKCAREVMTVLSPTYEVKGVQLVVEPRVNTEADWWVQGEESRLRRVFSNLLENALRYSPAGSRVTVGVEEEGEYRRAYVEDEGPGLPADLRPAEIFGLFSKGKEGGGKAGLGMYFCRITVERWGGSIGCTSLPKRGSRFWFRLPKAVARADAPRTKAGVRDEAVPKGFTLFPGPLRILFADDQEEIRILTAHQLQRRGHTVVTVTNGKEALEAASTAEFDIVLLDGEMPVLGGIEAAREFRERDKARSSHAILVALTGNNSDADQRRYLAAGFDSVLGKPLRMEALDALFGQISPGARGVLSEGPAAGGQNARLAETQELLKRVGGDKKLLRQISRTFLRDTPKRMAVMRKAIHKKNAESLAATAHALKGSVSIFGGGEAQRFAEDLQARGRTNDFRGAGAVYDSLQEEIAKLEANLRGYAGPNKKKAFSASNLKRRQTKKRKK